MRASPERIFAILTDASRHPDFDGSGMVQHLRTPYRALRLGATFTMDMKLGPVPYRMRNTVVEFTPNRLIAWRTIAPYRWRYQLEPVAGGTRVTESFDWSSLPAIGAPVFAATGLPRRNLTAIQASLATLADIVENTD